MRPPKFSFSIKRAPLGIDILVLTLLACAIATFFTNLELCFYPFITHSYCYSTNLNGAAASPPPSVDYSRPFPGVHIGDRDSPQFPAGRLTNDLQPEEEDVC